jgi:hypothetical protein
MTIRNGLCFLDVWRTVRLDASLDLFYYLGGMVISVKIGYYIFIYTNYSTWPIILF